MAFHRGSNFFESGGLHWNQLAHRYNPSIQQMRGHVYSLMESTFALENVNGKRVLVRLPVGSVLRIEGEADADGLVEVLWRGKSVYAFGIDIESRGIRTREYITNHAKRVPIGRRF